MKKIFVIIVLCLSCKSFAQSTFSSGFETGYKAGYCYGRPGCITPIVPIAPIGGFSYKDGYNKGFQMGLDIQRGLKIEYSHGYKGTEMTFLDNAMYKAPYELMMKIIDKKDKEFEDKYGSFENRDRIFKELLLKGLDAFNKKDYYGAINFCNQAEETLLTNPMIDIILGGSYYSIGDYDNSIRHLKTAKNNGYTEADEYIQLIKKKEREMTYERPIKFGAKLGYNISNIKSSPIIGLFFQGRTGKWNIKNFSIVEEILYFRNAQYETSTSPYVNSSKHLEVNNQILQMNIFGKNNLGDNFDITYGPGLSFLFVPAGSVIKLDLNLGVQYNLKYNLFTELRLNKSLGDSASMGGGIVNVEVAKYNLQLTLGYKF
jgi:tetratricopeptide (TPR) repeat protein